MSSQCHQFSLDEIRSSTNNFHQTYLIGSGGFGKVYKGRVNDSLVAIKRLRAESRQGEKEFRTEIAMLSKLQHDNLVSLLGYCNESQESLLVYQYMERGTLDDHLYKLAAKKVFHPPLSWNKRLKISIGAAYGLWYLHEKQVIHRDVKSSNILIDENWVAKISDFGLSRMGPGDESLLSHVSTDVKGTFGYLCPEYYQMRMLSYKSDVYAFGVVLLEVLTGRPPVDMSLPDEQYGLAAWAQNCIRNGNVDGIIDPTLLRQIAPACLTKYVGIALRCLKKFPQERPSMFDVVKHLDLALVSQQRPDDSEDVIEVSKIHNHGNTTPDYTTTSLTAETITSITTDNISTEFMTEHGLKEKDLSGKVPTKKWWYLSHYFRKSPKPSNEFSHSFDGHWGTVRNLSYNEILVATNDFSHSIEGHWGTVCKGRTKDEKRVVVLRSYRETRLTMQELQSLLGRSPLGNHAPSALIGYCVHENHVIIMFDDIDKANSSLSIHLHEPVKEPLSWNERLLICIDAARVLKCLEAVEMQFMTFTSGDIHLDEGLFARIDLYKEAENIESEDLSNDSVYALSGRSIFKAGVFSFGTILFEVLYPHIRSRPGNEFKVYDAIAAEFTMRGRDKNYTRHFDPYLKGKMSQESSKVFLEIASRCLHSDGRNRPTMSEVVSQLEMAFQLQEA